MAATILSGTKIAAALKEELAAEIAALKQGGVSPGLAVVLVGEDPASQVYVRNKVKTCHAVGMRSESFVLPASTTTGELLQLVAALNSRDDVDGILVQLPLPAHVDTKKVLLAVDPAKDVDGFHPVNVGNLSTQRPGLVPCTPAGVMEILARSGIAVAGTNAVVTAGRVPRGRHPRRGDRSRGDGDAVLRQARRGGDRRRDQPRDRPSDIRAPVRRRREA